MEARDKNGSESTRRRRNAATDRALAAFAAENARLTGWDDALVEELLITLA